MIVSKSQSQATLPEERSRRLTSCTIGDSVLYHSLSRTRNQDKKNLILLVPIHITFDKSAPITPTIEHYDLTSYLSPVALALWFPL
jgi:hypothetical protein